VADVGELEGHTLGAPDSDKPVPTVTDVTSYVVSRVQPQIDTYYRVRAAQLQKRLRLFRGAEYALAMLAAGRLDGVGDHLHGCHGPTGHHAEDVAGQRRLPALAQWDGDDGDCGPGRRIGR